MVCWQVYVKVKIVSTNKLSQQNNSTFIYSVYRSIILLIDGPIYTRVYEKQTDLL